MKKISTEKAPKAIGPYSQGIIANGFLYTSGQIPLGAESGLIVGENIKEQTEQVMKNLQEILLASGTTMDKIVKTTCFLKDISDFSDFNEVYAKYIKNAPARSCVAVKDLPKGALVEVEVIATV